MVTRGSDDAQAKLGRLRALRGRALALALAGATLLAGAGDGGTPAPGPAPAAPASGAATAPPGPRSAAPRPPVPMRPAAGTLKADLVAPGIALRVRPAAAAVVLEIEPPLLAALHPAPRADGTDATQVLRVPEELPTIAAALAAAPDGAVIRIAPGVYRERLTVRRSVTLAGARGGDTILEGTRGLDRILLADTGGRAVRLESLVFRSARVVGAASAGPVATAGVDSPDGVVVRGTRVTVAGCSFERLRTGLTLEDAPSSEVRANRFSGNAVAVRIRGGAPLVAFNVIRGPGEIGVQGAGTDAAVALNLMEGVAVGAAFAGAGAAPLFAGNSVIDTTHMGVFVDTGVGAEIRGSLFLRAGAAVVVVDALAHSERNLFWENARGDYLRDAERTGALVPLIPPPAGPDVRADPRLDDAHVPGAGSPALNAGDVGALGRAGLGALLGEPVPPPPIGAFGLPAPAPRPGVLTPGLAAEDDRRPRFSTATDLRLLLGLVRDDCGGTLEIASVRDAIATLSCARCGRALPVRLGFSRGPTTPDARPAAAVVGAAAAPRPPAAPPPAGAPAPSGAPPPAPATTAAPAATATGSAAP